MTALHAVFCLVVCRLAAVYHVHDEMVRRFSYSFAFLACNVKRANAAGIGRMGAQKGHCRYGLGRFYASPMARRTQSQSCFRPGRRPFRSSTRTYAEWYA